MSQLVLTTVLSFTHYVLVLATAGKAHEPVQQLGVTLKKRRGSNNGFRQFGAAAKAARPRNGEEVAILNENANSDDSALWIIARVNKVSALLWL
jgi:hypothetical protein